MAQEIDLLGLFSEYPPTILLYYIQKGEPEKAELLDDRFETVNAGRWLDQWKTIGVVTGSADIEMTVNHNLIVEAIPSVYHSQLVDALDNGLDSDVLADMIAAGIDASIQSYQRTMTLNDILHTITAQLRVVELMDDDVETGLDSTPLAEGVANHVR